MAKRDCSPLRYPGGKNCLTEFMMDIAIANDLTGGTYIELYAGGAGAALNLLYNGTYSHIHLNDYDPHIHAMWDAILNYNADFVNKIKRTPITIKEWHSQRKIFDKADNSKVVELGFATFFLNRTNRSGIIFKAGPIGGFEQTGNYLIDVRFNKENLIKRVQKIAQYRDQITLTNEDAITLIDEIDNYYPDNDRLFIYLDPPYYKKGKHLYMNNYEHSDHVSLRDAINLELLQYHWIVSYDNVQEIKDIYEGYRMSAFDLSYSLQQKRLGSELLIFSDQIEICEDLNIHNRVTAIELL